MIYPKARRRHVRKDADPWSGVALAGLGLELAPLEPLCRAGWEPLVFRMAVLVDAIRGEGGATGREVTELRRWATAWATVRPDIRKFYVDTVADLHPSDPYDIAAVKAALYRMLNGGTELQGWQHGRIRRLWTARYGTNPSIDLTPLPT